VVVGLFLRADIFSQVCKSLLDDLFSVFDHFKLFSLKLEFSSFVVVRLGQLLHILFYRLDEDFLFFCLAVEQAHLLAYFFLEHLILHFERLLKLLTSYFLILELLQGLYLI